MPEADAVLQRAAEFLVKEEGCPPKPYWPKGDNSGVTWGIGWDAGHHTGAEIAADWSDLPAADLARLKAMAGKKGDKAAAALEDVKTIAIPKETSLEVFKEKTLPDYYKKTLNAFPGCYLLPVPVQVALISLVYNRGAGLNDKKGTNDRLEMRMIRFYVQAQDIASIADELRSMKRVWKGTDIQRLMNHRREAEARLVDEALVCSVETPELRTDFAPLICQ